jgi:hypothetical protein
MTSQFLYSHAIVVLGIFFYLHLVAVILLPLLSFTVYFYIYPWVVYSAGPGVPSFIFTWKGVSFNLVGYGHSNSGLCNVFSFYLWNDFLECVQPNLSSGIEVSPLQVITTVISGIGTRIGVRC